MAPGAVVEAPLHRARRLEKFLAMLYGADHPRIGLLKKLSPLFFQVLKWRYRIRPETVEESREKVRAAFDMIETEAGPSGYLVGDHFSVADLTLAALLSQTVAPEQFPYPQAQRGHPRVAPIRDALAEEGLLQWTLDMYARHRGSSAEIAR